MFQVQLPVLWLFDTIELYPDIAQRVSVMHRTHIGPGISPRLPYQARQRSWSADMGRGLIPGTIWKISCHNLFITYFTLTFSSIDFYTTHISAPASLSGLIWESRADTRANMENVM
jgi:hypothetical protein